MSKACATKVQQESWYVRNFAWNTATWHAMLLITVSAHPEYTQCDLALQRVPSASSRIARHFTPVFAGASAFYGTQLHMGHNNGSKWFMSQWLENRYDKHDLLPANVYPHPHAIVIVTCML